MRRELLAIALGTVLAGLALLMGAAILLDPARSPGPPRVVVIPLPIPTPYGTPWK